MAEEKQTEAMRLSADELNKAAGGDWDSEYKKGDVIDYWCPKCGCNKFVCVGGVDPDPEDPFSGMVWFECCACKATLYYETNDMGFAGVR